MEPILVTKKCTSVKLIDTLTVAWDAVVVKMNKIRQEYQVMMVTRPANRDLVDYDSQKFDWKAGAGRLKSNRKNCQSMQRLVTKSSFCSLLNKFPL